MNCYEQIKQLKQLKRSNTLFFRRRIDRGDGKKTLGWIMVDDKFKKLENTNINILKTHLEKGI
jgi:hypothetical protein